MLSQATVPDPGIAVFQFPLAAAIRDAISADFTRVRHEAATGCGGWRYLPDFKAFRSGEVGRHHNPEFSLLEWYRLRWDHAALMREVAALVEEVLGIQGWQVWPYGALFGELMAIDPFEGGDPHSVPASWLEIAREQVGEIPEALDRDAVLDLLMSHCIKPAIRDWGVVFVTDFPPSQAALARINVDGTEVAARFECYVHGHELANGYWEQTDAEALTAQLNRENARRKMRGLMPRPIDERLLAAHQHGLPDCAGVALGVDRLLALKLGAERLSSVISFDWPVA